MRVINTGKVHVKLWLDDLEPGAEAQVNNLANLPFAFHHVAMMPDAHQGYGMPIGGVLATTGAVIPNAVGVDIGCGMCAKPLGVRVEDLPVERLKRIMGTIRKTIPVGFAHQAEKQSLDSVPALGVETKVPIVAREFQAALSQVGTLGGGNHFIEIQHAHGNVWAMIHSGSRNIGLKVAKHYNELANELNARWCSAIPKEWELAFLPIDSDEGQAYLREMQYCVEFALANRKLMLERLCQAFAQEFGMVADAPPINIAHNYAAMEHHFGRNVMVHRKGATKATEGLLGIIPGSQGTKSYIVRGKGNPDSFYSCSHGAGRKMGRKEACRRLSLEEEQRRLDDQGIVHGIRNVTDLDEAAGAYKDIGAVMANQTDLVEVVTELVPMGVIKG